MDIVTSNSNYTYEKYKNNLIELKQKYDFLEIGSIGKSILGKDIWGIKIGKGNKKVFYNGAIHANEWITAVLLMKFLENYSKAYNSKSKLNEYDSAEIYNSVSLYLVPMVNPDGVDLVTGGLKNVEKEYREYEKIANNFPRIPFPDGWKSNFNGVDLNLQFPAEWRIAKEIKYSQGFNKPAPRDFPGFGPLTEPEALSIYNFTLYHEFELVIAYHTQGEEIYWKFLNYQTEKAKKIGLKFAEVSGYKLSETPYASGFAGYKDWFLQQYQKPGYTIEAGKGINPLPIEQFNSIYEKNIGILIQGMVYNPE